MGLLEVIIQLKQLDEAMNSYQFFGSKIIKKFLPEGFWEDIFPIFSGLTSLAEMLYGGYRKDGENEHYDNCTPESQREWG